MIKAIIFDYGGVMTASGGGDEISQRLAKFLDLTIAQAHRMMQEPRSDFMKGKIDEAEFWKLIEKIHGQPVPSEKKKIFNTWEHMHPRPQMLDFVHKLKSHGYRIGLLSNVLPVTEAIIREQGAYRLFNPCLLSCKYGYAKPETQMYQELLKQLPDTKPEEVIFIDDQEKCLVPARAMGINTVLAKNAGQIINDVSKLLAD